MSWNQRHLKLLRDLDMVEMKPSGYWGLTEAGRDFLDQLDLLRALDDRPRAPQPTSPRRQARTGGQRGTAAPSKGTRPRDDGRAARRGAGGNDTR